MDPDIASEPVTRVTHKLKEGQNVCSVTVIHELEGAPKLAALVGGALEDRGVGDGHAWILR